jgi:hypothetical protein
MAKATNSVSSWGTIRTFMKVGSCSEALMNVIDRAFGHPMAIEEQGVMSLAGGIGLSGGACGALGAAVWALGMHCAALGLDYNAVNAKAGELIDHFLKSADFEFECAEIVGRRFEDAEDHAAYVHEGGCADIIEALAAFFREGRIDLKEISVEIPEKAARVVGAW